MYNKTHNWFNEPERPLDPPEDTRCVAATCECCGNEIYEGDDYFDLSELSPKLTGWCCADCISNAHHYDAEVRIW